MLALSIDDIKFYIIMKSCPVQHHVEASHLVEDIQKAE